MATAAVLVRFSSILFLILMSLCPICTKPPPAAAAANNVAVKVGVILELDTWFGVVGLSCIKMALDDFYAANPDYTTRLLISSRMATALDIVASASAAVDLIKNVQVQAIIGPSTSMQADFLADLGCKAHVPIISYSATSPSLSSNRTPYFIRATQNDSSQVRAISAIVQAFGWRIIVPIYVGDDVGQGFIPFLIDVFQDIGVRVPYRSVIPPLATDHQIVAELLKLKTMQTRVFVVHMRMNLGSRLLKKAKEVGMMEEGYVWILTDSLTKTLSSMDPSVIDASQGAIGITPYIPLSKRRENFTLRWKRKFQRENPDYLDPEMNVVGLRAYDTTFALAMAVEKLRSTNFGYINKPNISTNLTDLESFGVSASGPKLIRALNTIKFRGLSGGVRICDGQLQPSVYQIINVISKDGRGIGFWTEKHGISRTLNFINTANAYSTSKDNLGPVIWPGEAASPPRGWVVATSGKRLKVGVPKKGGFSEFVNVSKNGNKTTVKGYCIDIFEAAIKSLPYDVSLDYFSFENSSGTARGSYDDLIYQVYAGEYDIVVGDTTIIANRSTYVDFTLPYTDSGTSLIVPIRSKNKKKSAKMFLNPFTWQLWLTSICSFVFIGFVTWILEHRVNKDFRGPLSHQVGAMCYFTFSTMVFAQKERVFNNLARFVLVIRVFIVVILTTSYTACLTSILTAEKLNHPTTNILDLLRNRENVGYQKGSFALGLLKGLGARDINLWAYNSEEECHSLFQNKTIVAAFDEIPYARLFHAMHCSDYAIIEQTYRTDGFGFVFPRGSPLATDVSRAILNVTQGNDIADIERAWLQKYKACPDNSTFSSSNSLGLGNFWGLFLVIYITSILAILIYVVMFLYDHWHVFQDPQTSFWQKLVILVRHHDEKDLTSHTFRRTGRVHDESRADDACKVEIASHSVGEDSSSYNNGRQSQTSASNAEGNFAFHGEQVNNDLENQTHANQNIEQEIEIAIQPQLRLENNVQEN